MAGVNFVEGQALDQLRLIAGMRWHIFVNSLRTRRGKADLVGRVVVGLIFGTAVVGIGVLLAFGSWAAFHESSQLILVAELWAILVVWQFLPIFLTGFGAQADLGLLLRFPLRYTSFFALTMTYGVMDPVAIAAVYWLVMVLAGTAVAAPGALAWAISALGLFVVVNLLLNRSIFAWLDRWLAQRRTREILGVGFFLVMMSFQLIGPLSERWSKRALSTVARIVPMQRPLPPGLAAYAITTGYLGQPLAALAALGGLLAAAAVLAWLLGIRLRAQYRGESWSEAPRVASVRQAGAPLEGWKLPGLSPVLAALVEKDLRYLLRNTSQLLNLAVPLILVLVFSLSSGRRERYPLFDTATFFPLAVGYSLLVVAGVTYNSLGYDGPGVAMLLTAPVRFRDVLLSKNLLHGLLVLIEVLLVSTLVVSVAGVPSGLTVALTLSGALFVILLSFAAGNLVSLYFPKRLQFGTMRRQAQSGIAALATILVPVTAMGIATGFYALCRWTGHSEWAVILLLALAGIAFVTYQRVLAASGGVAAKTRDVLIAEFCKGQ